jgi:hypothetical protein
MNSLSKPEQELQQLRDNIAQLGIELIEKRVNGILYCPTRQLVALGWIFSAWDQNAKEWKKMPYPISVGTIDCPNCSPDHIAITFGPGPRAIVDALTGADVCIETS